MSEKKKVNDAYKKFAEELEDVEKKDKDKRTHTLKKGILDLEQKYREEIKGTHIVDERLVKLRIEAGMPELIGSGDRVQKKRFKDKEKFDQFLAKEVLEVGIEETKKFGGVIPFNDFCNIFHDKRANWEAPSNEILKALELLAISGLIPKLYKMKNNDILITFKPNELHTDLLTILNLVSNQGVTTVVEVMKVLGWVKERAELTLHTMVEQEIAIYDKKGQQYFFPAFKINS